LRNIDDSDIKRGIDRRSFLGFTGAAAVATVVGGLSTPAVAEPGVQPHITGRRKLGSLEVSTLGLGVQNMSRKYETTVPYRPEMINIIRAAYDHGVTFFDTAEAYGPFECERILGEGIAPFRNKVVITSKFGWNIDPETGQFRLGLNSKPDHIKRAVEGTLKRLRTDRIDLLYQHRVDPEVPIEDVAGAVKDLMSEGKVLHWGLCEMGPNTLRRAHAALSAASQDSDRRTESIRFRLCRLSNLDMKLPPPMKSFLHQYSFAGKTIIPFNSNGGYGPGSTFQTVRELCPQSTVLQGFSTRGGSERDGQLLAIKDARAEEVRKEVGNWLRTVGMFK
jgi:hypothetical protein